MTRTRNSVKDRPAKWKLLLRRQKRLLRPGGWVAFAAVIGVLVLVVARTAAPGSSIVTLRERLGSAAGSVGLRVTDVRIEGRENTPEPLLRAAIGVSKGDPILGFSVEQARQRIESLSWVEHATVERRLPGTVVVILDERAPFAIWQNQGKFVLIDRKGQVVTNQEVSQFRNLPLVVGIGAPQAARELLDALTERPAIAGRMEAAVRVAARRWNLHMKNGADVMLPEGHEIAALDRLIQLQESQAVLDRPLAAIDMRLPDRLVLRPKAEQRNDAAPPAATPAAALGSAPTPPPAPVVARKTM